MAMIKINVYSIMLFIATLSLACAGCKDSGGIPSSEKDIMKLAQRVNDDAERMNPTVVFMSDFGDTEAVAICHQMMKRIDGAIEIINFNHNVNTFNVDHGSILLERSRDFVNGTVFMAVVDPGVGTQRRPIILKTKKKGLYFIGPNNGVFTDVADIFGIDSVNEIIPKKVNPNWSGWTFDGRDLYSPAAAMVALSRGAAVRHITKRMDVSDFIKIKTEDRVKLFSDAIIAKIVAIDEPYGNVWTQVKPSDLKKIGLKEGDELMITVLKTKTKLKMKWVHAFGNVPSGADLAYLDSRAGLGSGYFSLGVNTGDFRQKHRLGPGDFIRISKAR
jgi:S-adenosyl-L-methionine hydrolase (adenosine-forming)